MLLIFVMNTIFKKLCQQNFYDVLQREYFKPFYSKGFQNKPWQRGGGKQIKSGNYFPRLFILV